MIFIVWIGLCFLVALTGKGKKIGYGGVLVFSLILSPLIGLIIGLCSADEVKKPEIVKANEKAENLKNEAIKKYLNKEYDESIKLVEEALLLQPNDPIAHFNISMVYSKVENKEPAYNHLSRAVDLGYKNFEKINTHSDFEFLRSQPEYKAFAMNGYKIK